MMDRIDRILLASLQEDARLTVADLAERASLTASPCWRRVKALEDDQIILGYHADLDPRRLGYDVTVFVSVMLENHQLGLGQSFESAVLAIPEIIAGTMDAVPVTTLETLQDVLEADQQAREVALEAVRRKE